MSDVCASWSWRRVARAVAAAAVVLTAGGGLARPASAPRVQEGPVAVRAVRLQQAAATSRAAHRPTKLLVVVLENRDASRVRAEMPYLSAQATRYGQATSYFGVTHPSLPNYLTMAAGTTFGIRDDRGPAGHRLRGASVFGQALARHRT